MNTRSVRVIGVDPGRTTGIAALHFTNNKLERASLIQATPDVTRLIIESLLENGQPVDQLVLAVERFVVRSRAARSADAEAGQITRDLIGALNALGYVHTMQVFLRTASEVKPWATDKRLVEVGVTGLSGMRHAADAARHALFSAVRDCGIPDPLSARSPR